MNGRRGSSPAIAIAAALIALANAEGARAEEPAPKKEPAPSASPQTPPATPKPKPARKKVQEVDPRRLEIQGQIESPKSTFILEAGGSLIPDIGSLDGLLRGPWIPPIDKEALDHYVVVTIEKGDRP